MRITCRAGARRTRSLFRPPKPRRSPPRTRPLAIDFPRASEETTGKTMPSEPMSNSPLQIVIERAFEDRAAIGAGTQGEVRDAVERALNLLDAGEARVAEKI